MGVKPPRLLLPVGLMLHHVDINHPLVDEIHSEHEILLLLLLLLHLLLFVLQLLFPVRIVHLLHGFSLFDTIGVLLFQEARDISALDLLGDFIKLEGDKLFLLLKFDVVLFGIIKLFLEVVLLRIYVIHPLYEHFYLQILFCVFSF